MENNNEYKTCPDCCYDILDDEGDVMEHECISDNEMIAEFMGLEFRNGDFFMPKTSRGYVGGDWLSSSELQYHTSWDWLMPVIIKIADMRNDTHYTLYQSIEDAYNEVVEFIKTHNDEQQ